MLEEDCSYADDSVTLAVVANFPDRDAEVVRIYSVDYEDVQLMLRILGKLSTSSVHLKTPYGGF